MAPGDETSRVHHGGVSQAGGRSPRPSGDVCAESLCLGDSLETRGVLYSGARRLGGGVGNNIWVGKTSACCNLFSVRLDPSLYNAT